MSYGDLVEFLCPVLPSVIAGKSPERDGDKRRPRKKSGNIKIKKEQQQKAKKRTMFWDDSQKVSQSTLHIYCDMPT